MPEYPTKKELKKFLTIAIYEGSSGFLIR